MQSPWKRLVEVPKNFLEVVKLRRNPRTQCSVFFGLVSDPSVVKNADHDALSLLSSVEAHSTFLDEMIGSCLSRCR